MIIKCPECNHEIEGIKCTACNESTPAGSIYCINCGKNLQEEPEDSSDEDDSIDFDDRILCSDGACTGIIIDGKCSECGKPPEPEA